MELKRPLNGLGKCYIIPNMMRYKGLDTRDAFMLSLFPARPDFSYLEIGVGIGGTIDKLLKDHGMYCGVDIAQKTIDYLRRFYGNIDQRTFICCDACSPHSDLGRKFDVVFSADTLEHVYSAENFFAFIARHLKQGGKAYVVYPNESAECHHGILWFDTQQKLMEKIAPSGLQFKSLERIELTRWHKVIKKIFWQIPKSIFIRRAKIKPQVFDDTDAFHFAEKNTLFSKIIAFYAACVSKFIRLFPTYTRLSNVDGIQNKILLITLER